MSTLHLKYKRIAHRKIGTAQELPKSAFASFNPSILGLGKISREAEYQEALAAIFDLEGFTTFCSQIDPHLVVPEYLEQLLTWLFDAISKEFKLEETTDEILLWSPLPFFAKFLGDGVLFLWNTKGMHAKDIGNIVASLLSICRSYRGQFFTEARGNFVRVPPRLRCGIARGQVVAVGEKADFVGPCINMAARLQKLGTYSFAFSRRGFDLDRNFEKGWKKEFSTQNVDVRGVGEDELVYVLNEECSTPGRETKKG